MTISFHPEDATLIGFAAGALSEPFAIVVSAHVEMCEVCRRRLGAMTALGGAIAASEPFEAVDADAFDRLLGRLEAAEAPGAAVASRLPAPPNAEADLPGSLARLVGGGYDSIQWREIVPGAEDRRYRFANRRGAQILRFLRAAPGQAIPEHTHPGQELTLVLRGALRDGERIHWPGDVTDLSGPTAHNPVAHGDELCVCVIAEEGPPQFASPAMRALQERMGL